MVVTLFASRLLIMAVDDVVPPPIDDGVVVLAPLDRVAVGDIGTVVDDVVIAATVATLPMVGFTSDGVPT